MKIKVPSLEAGPALVGGAIGVITGIQGLNAIDTLIIITMGYVAWKALLHHTK